MIADVALPLPIDKTFSYILPENIASYAKLLARVKVPFRNRSLTGFIVNLTEGEKLGLKPVIELIDCIPLLDETCFRLCRWASEYYVTPIGLALKYALSSSITLEKYCTVKTALPSFSRLNDVKLRKAYALAGKDAVLQYLGESRITLHDRFTGKAVETAKTRDAMEPKPRARLYLAAATERLALYVSLISEQIEKGSNILMLLPDYYGAGNFFYRIFSDRFPGSVLWYGSAIPAKTKAETYFRARQQGGNLILGNKSCVFLPAMETGLIIVERPEEDEYRNEEAFKFNAVRLAIKRAEIEHVPIVLGSVSPDLEMIKWAGEGTIDLDEASRLDGSGIAIIRSEKRKGAGEGLPDSLIEAVRSSIDQSGNTVIHTPRRAYASYLYCLFCRQPLLCPRCSSALAFSRAGENLACGFCKQSFPYEEKCSGCGSDLLRFSQVGAEFLETELRSLFPKKTVIRVTGDADEQNQVRRFLADIKDRKGCIVVGTHILSKLYGLPVSHLILHGWEDLQRVAGFRAGEKMFQMFRNLLDSLIPDRVSLLAGVKETFDMNGFLDEKRFYEDELQKRRIAEFPPYVRLFLVTVLPGTGKTWERTLKAVDAAIEKENMQHFVLGRRQAKGGHGSKIVLKGDEKSLAPLFTLLYRLPGIHIEADPLYL
jgi:primosomal protein N' (replication factor Y)